MKNNIKQEPVRLFPAMIDEHVRVSSFLKDELQNIIVYATSTVTILENLNPSNQI